MAIRVLKSTFTASRDDIDRLFACNRISGMIWNKCLALTKEYQASHNGAWIPKKELRLNLKNTYPFHSQSVQCVIGELLPPTLC